MQDKIFKVKIFEVTHKSVKSVKVFSLEIFRLYGIRLKAITPLRENRVWLRETIYERVSSTLLKYALLDYTAELSTQPRVLWLDK